MALLAGLATFAALAWGAASRAGGLLDFSPEERDRIAAHGPWPPSGQPPPRDAGNALSGRPAAIGLGRSLFFETRLSPAGVSCARCHDPKRAFADGQPRSTGVSELDRNAPSLWNAGQERWLGWDGGADSLWSQAIRPLLDPREMASNPGHIQQAIASRPMLAAQWLAVTGKPVGQTSPAEVLVFSAKALGAYVATLVSARTPFDDFRDALVRQDWRRAARYPMAAQRGLRLFMGHGNCHLCHGGPRFTHGEFADIGAKFFVRPGVVDPGRLGGIEALRASPYNLLSAWADAPGEEATKTRHVAPTHRNFGEFKVPSLRHVGQTAPYMHDGQLPTLQSVVRHYSALNVDRLHADGEQILKPLNLSAPEEADLVAFLLTLSPAPTVRRGR